MNKRQVDNGMGAKDLFPALLLQNGGSFYSCLLYTSGRFRCSVRCPKTDGTILRRDRQ